jgi:hypothetical protein
MELLCASLFERVETLEVALNVRREDAMTEPETDGRR